MKYVEYESTYGLYSYLMRTTLANTIWGCCERLVTVFQAENIPRILLGSTILKTKTSLEYSLGRQSSRRFAGSLKFSLLSPYHYRGVSDI